jgi:hypothetical protein
MKVDLSLRQLEPKDAEAIKALLGTPLPTTAQVSQAMEAQLGRYFRVPHPS